MEIIRFTDCIVISHFIAGDAVVQQFSSFLDIEAKNESFQAYSNADGGARIDTFLYEKMSKVYPELWDVCRKILLLSHGQTTVERGFSTNKEVEICNMHEDTVIAHRLVCDCNCKNKIQGLSGR